MMRTIAVLVFNDLAVTLKNKSFYLILFVPLFVFLSLRFIDRTGEGEGSSRIRIGLIQNYAYAHKITAGIKAAGNQAIITWVGNEEEGRRLLKEHAIDGMLIGNEKPGGLSLLVLKKESLPALAVVQFFSALQRAADGGKAGWITDVRSLQEGGIQRQTMPTWILMLVLLVGFVILPAQIAEDKEKKLLVALLQAPVREIQWLIAKLVLGVLLTISSVLVLHLLDNSGMKDLFRYSALIAAGSFCFSAYGIFLGFLCRTQASARTLGIIFYLPHLLPSALSDFSQKMTAVAPFLPSYQFYRPLQSILSGEGGAGSLLFDLMYLSSAGSVLFCLSWVLIKRRWLM